MHQASGIRRAIAAMASQAGIRYNFLLGPQHSCLIFVQPLNPEIPELFFFNSIGYSAKCFFIG
jgi:hypothetical protein